MMRLTRLLMAILTIQVTRWVVYIICLHGTWSLEGVKSSSGQQARIFTYNPN